MKPSQFIPFGQVDDAYDKLHEEHRLLKKEYELSLLELEQTKDAYTFRNEELEEVSRNLEFAFKRTMVIVNMLGLSEAVERSPAVTGTILGMVRREVERLKKFEMERI